MTKTSLETTTEALRLIGVTAVDESADAADHARAKAHLDAVYGEISDTLGMAPEWTVETVPDRLWPHVAAAVAGSICTAYGKADFIGMRRAGIRSVCADEFGNEMPKPTHADFF